MKRSARSYVLGFASGAAMALAFVSFFAFSAPAAAFALSLVAVAATHFDRSAT